MKTDQELLAKARHNWPVLLLKAVASTFFLTVPQLLISPIPKLTCSVTPKRNPTSSTHTEAKKNLLWSLPSQSSQPHIFFLHSSASMKVLPLSLPYTICLNTAALFHLNVNLLCSTRITVIRLLSLLYERDVTQIQAENGHTIKLNLLKCSWLFSLEFCHNEISSVSPSKRTNFSTFDTNPLYNNSQHS